VNSSQPLTNQNPRGHSKPSEPLCLGHWAASRTHQRPYALVSVERTNEALESLSYWVFDRGKQDKPEVGKKKHKTVWFFSQRTYNSRELVLETSTRGCLSPGCPEHRPDQLLLSQQPQQCAPI